jgi:hypothetical protein
VGALAALSGVTIHSIWPGPWAVLGATLLGASLGLAIERWKSARSS